MPPDLKARLHAALLGLAAAVRRLAHPDPHRTRVCLPVDLWDDEVIPAEAPVPAVGYPWADLATADPAPLPRVLLASLPVLADVADALARCRRLLDDATTGTGADAGQVDHPVAVLRVSLADLLAGPWGRVVTPDHPASWPPDAGTPGEYQYRCEAMVNVPNVELIDLWVGLAAGIRAEKVKAARRRPDPKTTSALQLYDRLITSGGKTVAEAEAIVWAKYGKREPGSLARQLRRHRGRSADRAA